MAMMNMKEHFKKEGFVVINNFLQSETVMLLYHHVKIMAQRQALILERKDEKLDVITNNKMFGTLMMNKLQEPFQCMVILLWIVYAI